GENPAEEEENALERLRDAIEDLQDAREQVQNELARERLLKIAEQIKLLKQRHEALVPETERIHREVLQAKEWSRPLGISLNREADAQDQIAQEGRALAKDKLKGADVFAHIMHKAADAMEQAAENMKKRAEKTPDKIGKELDLKAEEADQQQILRRQRE